MLLVLWRLNGGMWISQRRRLAGRRGAHIHQLTAALNVLQLNQQLRAAVQHFNMTRR
jgi:hypothetical protein